MATAKDTHLQAYAQEIHSFLRYKEKKPFKKYTGTSSQAIFRPHLVEYLTVASVHLKVNRFALHLAVYYLDIIIENQVFNSSQLELAALSCLQLAVKLEENDSQIPKTSELNEITRNRYKLKEFIEVEMDILGFFKWNLLFPTAAHFIDFYVPYILHISDHVCGRTLSLKNFNELKMPVQKYVNYFLDIIIYQEEICWQFDPSIAAAASICATRKTLVLTPLWPDRLIECTYYKYSQIEACVELLYSIFLLDEKELAKEEEESEAN